MIKQCKFCKVPVIQQAEESDGGICPICGWQMDYMAADLRPVFPEEIQLLAILFKADLQSWLQSSVWAADNKYFIGEESFSLSSKDFAAADVNDIAKKLEYGGTLDYSFFNKNVANFLRANLQRLDFLKDEATNFVKKAAAKFTEENIVVSFSGGKDSTVTADIVTKALGNFLPVHIFGNTTLEFPTTLEYVERYRKANPLSIFYFSKNEEQDFYKVCEDIGPPARMMRWCCSMFKTGPISRILNGLYRNQNILTFYGIRKNESAVRSKYNRIESTSASVKIQQQTVASPIFF